MDEPLKRISDTMFIDVPEEHGPLGRRDRVLEERPDEAPPQESNRTIRMLRSKMDGSLHQELLQNMYDGVIVSDLKGRIVEVNLRAAKLFHCEKPQLLETNMLQLVRNCERSFLDEINQHLRASRHVLLDVTCERLDGTDFPSEIAVMLLYVTSVGQLCFFVRDITERKRAEQALAREHELLQSLMDNIPDRIYFKDAKSRFLRINQALSDLLRVHFPDEAIGKTDFDFYPEAQAGAFYDDDQKVIKSGAPILDKVEKIQCADGSWRWSSTTKVPISGEDNDIIGLVGISRDITARKNAEEDLRSAQTQLDRVKRLEATALFAGQIAHDLNNLLVPLLVYPEVIKKEMEEGSQAYRDLDIMESTARQIADITQDLLALSRRGNVEQTVLNINELVQEVAEAFQRTVVPEGISVDFQSMAGLPNVLFGPPQLMRILQNLCQNAVDAMGEEGHLVIKTENTYLDTSLGNYVKVKPGEYVKIIISDDGSGISDDIKDKIFDPFFTTKAASGKRGSGLGLSVVYGIVKDHDGYVDMESAVGEGTTFSLYFPLCRREVSEESKAEVHGGSEEILVVDDDPLQVEVLSQILVDLGYTVEGVRNGEDALAIVRQRLEDAERLGREPEYPDLLILDMIMGDGIDGAETFRLVREINRRQKAITISGYRDPEKVEMVQQSGSGDHLMKPVTYEMIARAVRFELDRKIDEIL